jgi:hypothetical protein
MYFEKSSSRNWLVSVHQDLSIPVAERVEHASATTRKRGFIRWRGLVICIVLAF